MNCKNCGAPLQDGEKFCTNCGSKVDTTEDFYSDTNRSYSQPTYENNGYNEYNEYTRPRGNTLAIVSLVLGILSIVCCCFRGLNTACSLAALITGIISAKSTPNGKGMAIAGIVMGSFMLLMSIISIVMAISYLNVLMPNGSFNNFDELEDIIENFSL